MKIYGSLPLVLFNLACNTVSAMLVGMSTYRAGAGEGSHTTMFVQMFFCGLTIMATITSVRAYARAQLAKFWLVVDSNGQLYITEARHREKHPQSPISS